MVIFPSVMLVYQRVIVATHVSPRLLMIDGQDHTGSNTLEVTKSYQFTRN